MHPILIHNNIKWWLKGKEWRKMENQRRRLFMSFIQRLSLLTFIYWSKSSRMSMKEAKEESMDRWIDFMATTNHPINFTLFHQSNGSEESTNDCLNSTKHYRLVDGTTSPCSLVLVGWLVLKWAATNAANIVHFTATRLAISEAANLSLHAQSKATNRQLSNS